jgi:hypothetical protein
MNCTAEPLPPAARDTHNPPRHERPSTAAALAWVLALSAAAAALPLVAPATAQADACGTVGGRHWSVSGCPAPPTYYPPPAQTAPPSDYTPNATLCAQGGRWFSWSACK